MLKTISGHNALNDMKQNFHKLDFVTVGRVDFVSSMDKDREYVNTEEMKTKLVDIFY